MEVVSEAFIAKKQTMMSEDSFRKLYETAEEIARMMSGLRTSLLGNSRSAH